MEKKSEETRHQKELRLKREKERRQAILLTTTANLKKRPQIEPLTIDSDIQKYIRRLKQTEVLSEPVNPRHEFQQQVMSARQRMKKVKFGCSLERAVRSPPILMREQARPSLHILSEKEAITPSREYIVPQIKAPLSFILPDDLISSDAMRRENDLNKLKNRINEGDRKLYNDFAHEMNLREIRRESTMKQKYDDFIDFGMKESIRRDRRGIRIDDLRSTRSDLIWWNKFMDNFTIETKGNDDLDCVEELSKCTSFNELEIINVYKVGLSKSLIAADIFRKVIRQANEAGDFLTPVKLGMCFKLADDGSDQTNIENLYQ